MAVFVCRDTTTTYKVYNENFTVLYSGTLAGGNYWFACNRGANCFYVSENAVLTKRSLTDGALLATQFESVGAQKPIIVDRDGYLWTIDNTPSNVIRKWASDLSSRTDYTIKAGVIDDYISNMVMTYDGNYVYIIGGHGTAHPSENDVKVAKLAVSDLSGDAEWEKELYNESVLAYFYIRSIVVDESNNIYICGSYWDGTCLAKLSDSGIVQWEDLGGELFGSAPLEEGWVHFVSTWGIYFYITYSESTQSIYVCSVDNDFNSYIRQRQISDGDIVGSTAEFDWGYATCCAVYDDNLLFVGSIKLSGQTLNRLFTFDITDNWGESESASTSTLLINKPILAAGDPTGYLNWNLTQLKTPIASPGSGTIAAGTKITLSSPDSGVEIRYTLDDSEPSESSTLYVESIIIESSIILKAKAYKTGYKTSNTAEFGYSVSSGVVSTPIAQPNSGNLMYGTYIKLLCLTPNATIRYTLDGSIPDGASTIYVSPIAINNNTTLKAMAFKVGFENSNIGTFTYTVKVSNPEATPTPRYFKDSISVVLSCTTSGAEIRYTLDGGEPNINSQLYTKSLVI